MTPRTGKEKALSCGTSGTVFMSGLRNRDVVIEPGKLKLKRVLNGLYDMLESSFMKVSEKVAH